MRQITVDGPFLNVNSGQVALSKEQLAGRLHALRAVKVEKNGAGTYQVQAPIQFKRGERFGFDGEVSKAGVLHDPDAELLARLEAAEKAAKEAGDRVRAELQGALDHAEKTITDLTGQLAAANEKIAKFEAAQK